MYSSTIDLDDDDDPFAGEELLELEALVAEDAQERY